jgi:hypothetical protein|tara:strand:+ start:2608 stop:3717 length:1110 start_codon:yes stop_codon:yes gene_type:complete
MNKIQKISVNELKPHPMNETIYGKSDSLDEDLLFSISNHGLQEPLTITQDKVIISGHRRLRIIKQLGWDIVDCRVSHFDNPLLSIILSNKSRNKTSLQLLNEAEILQKEYTQYNYKGRRTDLHNDDRQPTIISVTKGLGISVSHLKRLRRVARANPNLLEMIDSGDLSVTGAYHLVRNDIDTKRFNGLATPSNIRHFQDYYPTHPKITKALLEREIFDGSIWENACGEGHMSDVIKDYGYKVFSSDLVDRGYGKGGVDFLNDDTINDIGKFDNIITNPPFSDFDKFVVQSKKVATKKIALISKTQYLQGIKRHNIFIDKDFPLKIVYQFSGRVSFQKNTIDQINSMMAFAWFVFEKGYKGKPQIEFIQP